MKNLTLSLLLSLTALLAIESPKDIIVVATPVVEENLTTEQNITQVSDEYKDTIIYAKALKESYKVNEPIIISVKLKRDAYIYFWTVAKSGKGYLILPNNFAKVEEYKALTEHNIPNKEALYQFVSDAKGTEKVYLLATSKPISVARISAIFYKAPSSVVPEASAEDMKSFPNKDMKVIAKEENLKYDIEQFEVKVD
ncbi:hypothetical protein MNB_SV-9-501 [hydrothermal vent metagenome]|uniref:DUF4384 domain-containing protein n=1 Tax=hydrothermal vent metagenome TaxID=652676 RepID=A0A1W1BWT6_9ZZZZ